VRRERHPDVENRPVRLDKARWEADGQQWYDSLPLPDIGQRGQARGAGGGGGDGVAEVSEDVIDDAGLEAEEEASPGDAGDPETGAEHSG